MRVLVFVSMVVGFVFAQGEWKTKRNPFLVDQEYIEQTGKHYLIPKDTYITFDIKLVGIFMKDGRKSALLDIEDRGFVYLLELQETVIPTSDIESSIKMLEIAQTYVKISINNGEAVRYDIK